MQLFRETSPTWFRAQIAKSMSRLALRPDGVVKMIRAVASYHPTNTDKVALPSSDALGIPEQVVKQVGSVLSSPPIDPEAGDTETQTIEWFTKLAPQLWDMIDSKHGSDMQFAAAYIIGESILVTRQIAAPGKIGAELFIKPLAQTVGETLAKSKDEDSAINSASFRLRLSRLASLLGSWPNQRLAKRFLLLKPSLDGCSARQTTPKDVAELCNRIVEALDEVPPTQKPEIDRSTR
jgi:hypothetical protein